MEEKKVNTQDIVESAPKKRNVMNPDNPKYHQLTDADRRKAGKVNKDRHAFRAALKDLLTLDCEDIDKELHNILVARGIDPNNINAINLSMVRNAVKGDRASAEFVRDTCGEKPTTELKMGNGAMVIAIKGEDDLQD